MCVCVCVGGLGGCQEAGCHEQHLRNLCLLQNISVPPPNPCQVSNDADAKDICMAFESLRKIKGVETPVERFKGAGKGHTIKMSGRVLVSFDRSSDGSGCGPNVQGEGGRDAQPRVWC